MIVFHNEGIVPLEAFTTFGINAKPNSDNPIGYFGTGLKYAVAVTLRLGGRFRLFRGTEEYEFYLKETDFRGKEFQIVRMKRRRGLTARWKYDQLPFSTELGKNWEPWMAVRELESNTRDENGSSFVPMSNLGVKLHASEYPTDADNLVTGDKTVIIIECPEMEEAYDNLDHIFMPEKPLLYEIGHLQIFEGESPYLFFRGLRVTDFTHPSKFTYNFTSGFTLTEDRTSKNTYLDNHAIMEAIMRLEQPDFVAAIMDLEEDKWFESGLPFDQPYVVPSTTYTAALGHRMTSGGYVPPRMKTYYKARQKAVAMEQMVEVSLPVSKWKELVKLMGMSDIHNIATSEGNNVPEQVEKAIVEAMQAEDVPF